MLRSAIHVGLATMLVIAPALCCCTVRLLAAQLAVSPVAGHSCRACPEQEPSLPSCCHSDARLSTRSCCTTEQPPTGGGDHHERQKQPLERCEMCFATTDAIPPESPPTISDPAPTGELISVSMLGLAAYPPEHLGLVGGLDPPERAGVDVRSDSLDLRHVLRC